MQYRIASRRVYNSRVSRLAWFTPLAPVRSGISAYSAELLPAIRAQHDVDVYDESGAHDFVPRHLRAPYDLVVYQMGNASHHDYMWAYLLRHPGLLVLHDAQLHQSRALALLTRRWRPLDYQAEFKYSHPEAPIEVSNFVIDGKCRTLFGFWPMLRLAVERSRLVAVHNPWLARDLAAQFPASPIVPIRMGVTKLSPNRTADLRARLGIAPGQVVFASFGRITPEKRLGPLFEALARVSRERHVHLLLIGEVAPYYDVISELERHGIRDRTTLTGFVDDTVLGTYLDAADVCVCLRWPTSRETSASWLRCLAAGKPTIVTELAHVASVATLEPYGWATRQGAIDDPTVDLGPIAVGLDLIDEPYSIQHAMRRLAIDSELRAVLGTRAREYWQRQHMLEHMAEDYSRILQRALAAADPPVPPALPHLRRDGTSGIDAIFRETGLDPSRVDILGSLDSLE